MDEGGWTFFKDGWEWVKLYFLSGRKRRKYILGGWTW